MNEYVLYEDTFRFNDIVEATCVFMPRKEVIGRLVQVRKKTGQFGSDVYFIRRFSTGKLMTFENVGLRHYDEPLFENAIDRMEIDSPEQEYTISGEFPEIGFIIE